MSSAVTLCLTLASDPAASAEDFVKVHRHPGNVKGNFDVLVLR
jgi:hypothetical protein